MKQTKDNQKKDPARHNFNFNQMKMKQAKDNQKIDPAGHNFLINLGITKHNFFLFFSIFLFVSTL